MKNWLRQITNFLPLIAIGVIVYSLPKFTNQNSDRALLSIPQNRELPSSEVSQVVKVSDGDTITVSRGMEKQKVRFACIDAPELAQPLGKESRDYLKSLITQNGSRVTLKIVDTDRYGRKVAEVFAGSKFLQAEQVKSGMVYVYDRYLNNCPEAAAVKQAQDFAKRSRVGVWSGNYTKPWDYRKTKRN
jgi:endonuclease YncB( thermonuclease family)